MRRRGAKRVPALTIHQSLFTTHFSNGEPALAAGAWTHRGRERWQRKYRAIRAINLGDSYLSPSISKKVICEYIRKAEIGEGGRLDDLLSNREREVLQLIAEGNSILQIASLLFISKKTAEAHKTHIMEKLNIHDRVGLVNYAIRTGLAKA